MKDSEIIDLYWARSEAAISATEEAYGGYCCAIAYHILRSRRDAEECVNDTFLRAWNAMPPHRPNRLSTFLGKITRNLAINRYRESRTEKRGRGQVELVLSELEDCVPAENTVDRAVEELALTEALNRFLRAQPERKRSIFILRYWYLYPVREIAARYGMRETGVASLLFRMRKELKAYLEKEEILL